MTSLSGVTVLVTSGPTREPFDPVRYISNYSSGKQGHAIAEALAEAGARVTLVTGPVSIPDPAGVRVLHVSTAQEMFVACASVTPVQVAICAAAVSDWRPESISEQKRKKREGEEDMTLKLVKNPDILYHISTHSTKDRPALVIGFAAETENLIPQAQAKRMRKQCDWILANDVSPAEYIYGGDTNQVYFLNGVEVEEWPRMTKKDVAKKLVERIAAHLAK